MVFFFALRFSIERATFSALLRSSSYTFKSVSFFSTTKVLMPWALTLIFNNPYLTFSCFSWAFFATLSNSVGTIGEEVVSLSFLALFFNFLLFLPRFLFPPFFFSLFSFLHFFLVILPFFVFLFLLLSLLLFFLNLFFFFFFSFPSLLAFLEAFLIEKPFHLLASLFQLHWLSMTSRFLFHSSLSKTLALTRDLYYSFFHNLLL